MLSNLISSRLASVAGVIVPTAAEVRSLSSQMAHRASERLDAIDRSLAGEVRFDGIRFDGSRQADQDAYRRQAALRLLAADHARVNPVTTDLMRNRGARLDAVIPQASQALVEIYNQVYEIEHADLAAWDGQILDKKTDIDPAAEEVVTYERDIVGNPRVASSYDTTSIPMVNGPVAGVGLREQILPALVGYEGNFMEPRRTALARANGKPDFMIEQGKIEACHRGIAEFYNALWLYGDTASSISGLHTNPFISNVPAPAGAWSGLTAQQLSDELSKLFNFIPDAAQGGGLGDMSKITLYLPPSQYNRIHDPTFANTTGLTPWQVFRDSHGLRDDQVRKVHSFAAANSAIFHGGPLGLTRDRAYVVYKKGDMWDPRFILSQPIEIPVPPRETGVGSVTYFHARGGGLWLPDARRVAYYEGL